MINRIQEYGLEVVVINVVIGLLFIFYTNRKLKDKKKINFIISASFILSLIVGFYYYGNFLQGVLDSGGGDQYYYVSNYYKDNVSFYNKNPGYPFILNLFYKYNLPLYFLPILNSYIFILILVYGYRITKISLGKQEAFVYVFISGFFPPFLYQTALIQKDLIVTLLLIITVYFFLQKKIKYIVMKLSIMTLLIYCFREGMALIPLVLSILSSTISNTKKIINSTIVLFLLIYYEKVSLIYSYINEYTTHVTNIDRYVKQNPGAVSSIFQGKSVITDPYLFIIGSLFFMIMPFPVIREGIYSFLYVVWPIYIIFFVNGAYILIKRKASKNIKFIFYTILLVLTISVVSYGGINIRFRIPAIPFIFMIAASGFVYFLKGVRIVPYLVIFSYIYLHIIYYAYKIA